MSLLDSNNPYSPPGTPQSAEESRTSGGIRPPWQRILATVAVGLFSFVPLAAFCAACTEIATRDWPVSFVRSAVYCILLSMFILAFLSLLATAISIYRRRKRGVVVGIRGTLAAVAIYVPLAWLAERHFF